LRAFLQHRVSAGGLRRLMGQWRHAGGLEAGGLLPPDKGPPPGGVMAPRCAPVFLQQVLDAWCVKDGQPRRPGRGCLTRVADDGMLGFALAADARRVMQGLPKRFSRCRRTRHPDQPGWVECKKPPYRERAAPSKGTVALRGLTHSWATTRRGYGGIKRKTVEKRLRRFMREIGPWCREPRHARLKEQSRT
jgi:RNA-directed DNA polymerase